MCHYDMFDDGQSQAGAAEVSASTVIDAVKSFKQSRQMLYRDARSLIAYMNGYFGITFFTHDIDFASRLTEFDGIMDEIDNRLLQ